MKIKGVLFDMDGTLARTEEKLQVALDRIIEDKLGTLPRERPTVFGIALDRICENVVRLTSDFGTPEDVKNKIIEENIKLIKTDLDVVENAVEAVKEITRMIPTGLVTGSSREETEAVLGTMGIINEFRFLLCNGEYPGSKPEPEPYLAGAEKLGLDAGECAAIEDSAAGVLSGKAAGCFTICFLDGREPSDRPGADVYIQDMAKLPGIIREQM